MIDADFQQLDAYQTTQYFRGKLYMYVDFLLSADYPEEVEQATLDAVIDFLNLVIKLVVQWMKKITTMGPLFAQ